VQSFASASVPGQTSAVLLRVLPPGGAAPADHGGARLWQLDSSDRSGRLPALSPSRLARDGGWLLHARVGPGTWFMRLEGAGGNRAALPADITFRISPGLPAVTYIGTFQVACDAAAAAGGTRPCRVDPVPVDESAAASVLVAAEGSGVAEPVTALARPYPPTLAATGLAAPSVPQFRVDTRLWLAAIDWNTLGTGNAPPPASAAEPRADAADFPDSRMVSVANMGRGMEGVGILMMLGVGLGVLVVAVPIYLIAREIQRDQQAHQAATEAQRQAEALRAAALAQQQWSPCTAGIAATLDPVNVERHLRATLAPGREAGRRAALPGPWQATVTRVILRHCGATPDSHGVEVATRWTATRPGESEPAYDAVFSRTVAGATPDARLVHSTRPPWEVPVASEAACRPLADYCGTAGTALLLQEVTRGVTEARDAIAAGR
jgi:hypothetical protein